MRVKVLAALIFTLFLFLIAGLFYLQIIKGSFYQNLSAKNRIRLIPIESPRGRIFDRNGTLLVDNRISFDLSVIPLELKDRKTLFHSLANTLGIKREALERSYKNNYLTPFKPVTIAADIDRRDAIMLEEERLDLPGAIIETSPRRRYLYKNSLSHVLGYLGRINQQELTKLKDYGYSRTDLIGKAGIERFYDNYLRGRHGGMQLEVNNRGYQVGILGIREPSKAKDLHLTIDIKLQNFIEEIFKDARAAACVMDVSSGEILSLVSTPSFDPNGFVEFGNDKELRSLLTRDDYPMLNRVLHCTYPPGSVFKIITAQVALEKEKITPETEFSCAGSYSLGRKTFKCWKKAGHGTQSIREAIKNSCNVFFYQTGRLLNADDIANFAARYGFGEPTGVDVENEASGLVPNKMWKLLKRKEPWYKGETLNYAIGQGYLLVTPMQIVRMTAAVANGGSLVAPYIVKRIADVHMHQTKASSVKISKETLSIVNDGLIKVVNDPRGTGRYAAVEGLMVAGKTGTAETSQEKTHAWFTGFAPAKDPKVALVVFLEYGGKGGLGASKTAGRIFSLLKEEGYL